MYLQLLTRTTTGLDFFVNPPHGQAKEALCRVSQAANHTVKLLVPGDYGAAPSRRTDSEEANGQQSKSSMLSVPSEAAQYPYARCKNASDIPYTCRHGRCQRGMSDRLPGSADPGRPRTMSTTAVARCLSQRWQPRHVDCIRLC